MTRTVLYTGKGGVGKTSIAAASAVSCSERGLKTLVISTDPAHSLADVFELELSDTPTAIAENLWGLEISPLNELQRHWTGVMNWLGGFLTDQGIATATAHELSVPPGMDELFSMLKLSEHIQSGEFDVVVVDCAPTGDTLRLLSYPEVAQWWISRLTSQRNELLGAARPIASLMFNLPLPDNAALGDVRQILKRLLTIGELLRDRERTSVRLVMTPERVVMKETMRTLTYLNLYGYQTDAIVVNRLLPSELVEDQPNLQGWYQQQQQILSQSRSSFTPIPTLTAAQSLDELTGRDRLANLADQLFVEHQPEVLLYSELTQRIELTDSKATLTLQVPFVRKEQIKLHKTGLELVIRTGTIKRTVVLPAKLEGYRPTGANYNGGALEIHFEHADEQNR